MSTEEHRIPISRVDPNNVTITYANDLLVTSSEKEIFLTFSQYEPPAVLPGENIDDIKDVKAVAVVRVVASREFAEKIRKLISAALGDAEKGES
jgi:hypothetical protein